MGITGPGTSGGLQKGDAKGFVVRFNSVTIITITLGSIEANGKIYTLAADDTHTITGFVGGYDLHYIYIDDSASTAPTAVIINSLTEPVFDTAKDGFYNGDDRCIGVVAETQQGGGNALGYFDTVIINERLIRLTSPRNVTPRMANLLTPTGSYQTPNINESSVLIPVNALELYIVMGGSDITLLTTAVAAASSEWAAAETVFSNAPFILFAIETVFSSDWLTLGASRNIKIAGESGDDPNSLSAEVGGWSYKR